MYIWGYDLWKVVINGEMGDDFDRWYRENWFSIGRKIK